MGRRQAHAPDTPARRHLGRNHGGSKARQDVDRSARILRPHRHRLLAAQVAQQRFQLRLKALLHFSRVALAQRPPHRAGKANRGTNSNIDAPGIQSLEEVNLLRHQKRRMVQQHDAGRAHPNALRVRRHMRRQHTRLACRNSRHTVVLGHQKSPETKPLYVLRVLSHLVQRAGRPAV